MHAAAQRQAEHVREPAPAASAIDADHDVDLALRRLSDAAAGAEGAPDDDSALAALRPLFEDIGWLRALGLSATRSLSADPFHLFGLTAMTSGPLQQLVFASGPRASVTLGTLGRIEDATPGAARSHAFVGNRSILRLLSDAPLDARLAILSRRTGACRERPISVMPDRLYAMDERRRVLWIAPPDRQALFLRARVRRQPAPLVGTWRVGETTPATLANGDDGLARSLALVAVLRTLGTPPPLDALRALLPRAHGSQRWQIMREMLALDTAAALPDLDSMASREADPAVRAAAGRLIARLAPRMEAEPCPC